jgi:hypothetical protein
MAVNQWTTLHPLKPVKQKVDSNFHFRFTERNVSALRFPVHVMDQGGENKPVHHIGEDITLPMGMLGLPFF